MLAGKNGSREWKTAIPAAKMQLSAIRTAMRRGRAALHAAIHALWGTTNFTCHFEEATGD